MMSSELWEKYKDWIDEDLRKQIVEIEDEDPDEASRMEDELYEKYGPTWKLRKDAPQEAVAAVEEEDRIYREAKAQGLML